MINQNSATKHVIHLEITKLLASISTRIESTKELLKLFDSKNAFQFNIFEFIQPNENKLTEILGYFLDPQKGHGQGKAFLEIFLHYFVRDSQAPRSFFDCKVYTEYPTLEGRRIDLLLDFDSLFAIAIENKVWAKDQQKQLADYSNHLEKVYNGNYILFYLNPYRSKPSFNSIDEVLYNKLIEEKKMAVIDYSTDLLRVLTLWIQHCQSDRVKHFLQDFEQYIQLEINGETFMNEFDIIADQVLKNEQDMQTALKIVEAADLIKQGVVSKFEDQLEKLCTKKQWRLELKTPFDKQYNGFFIDNPILEQIGVKIGFEFEMKGYQGFAFGVVKQANFNNESVNYIANKLNEVFGTTGKSSKTWPWFTFWDSYKNWTNKVFILVYNGELLTEVEQKVDKIMKSLGS